jgi:hypothetical protein
MTGYSNGSDAESEDYAMRCRMAEADEELSWRAHCEAQGERAWPMAEVPTQQQEDTNMKMNDAFPSKWLKGEDLRGMIHKVTIDRVAQEEVGQGADAELKLICYFVGKQKGVILNKTNASAIASRYGDESDDWAGAEVELRPEMVTYQGKTAPAIRIYPIVPQAAPGDEIPF